MADDNSPIELKYLRPVHVPIDVRDMSGYRIIYLFRTVRPSDIRISWETDWMLHIPSFCKDEPTLEEAQEAFDLQTYLQSVTPKPLSLVERIKQWLLHR